MISHNQLITVIISLIVVLFQSYQSIVVANKFFSFKLHKNSYPMTLCIFTLYMILMVCTLNFFMLDLDRTAEANQRIFNSSSDGIPSINGTIAAVASVNEKIMASSNEVKIDQPSFKFVWLSIYWLEFFLCWLVIPVAISYLSLKYACTHGQIRERLNKAIYQNLKFYILLFLGTSIGSIYLIFSTDHSLHDFKPLLIFLAYLYSLSYTLMLLTTGLITVPKSLLEIGIQVPDKFNNRMFVELSKTNDDMDDTQLIVLENATIILTTNELNNGDLTFNNLLAECKLEVQSMLTELKLDVQNPILNLQFTISTMDKLNNTYNQFITQYYNYGYKKRQSDHIIHYIAQAESSSLSLWAIRRYITILFGIVSMFLSILVFFLEITPTRWAHGWIFLGTNWYHYVLRYSIVIYNILVSGYALSQIKFKNLRLIDTGKSNPSNTLYFSLYCSRLMFPIFFNIISLIPTVSGDEIRKSSFEKTLYHDLTSIPLANILNKYAPAIFMILIPLSYKYDLKQKVLLKVLGEDYYYQFFGMMLYEPVNNTSDEVDSESALNEDSSNSRHLDEDYAYSLQDGRYLFERASSNFTMSNKKLNDARNI